MNKVYTQYSQDILSKIRSDCQSPSKKLPVAKSGWYRVERLTQNMVEVYLPEGRVLGPWISNEDSQSESPKNIPVSAQMWVAINNLLQILKPVPNPDTPYSESIEDYSNQETILNNESDSEQAGITAIDEISHWTHQRITSEILTPDATRDPSRLRELILVAEDTGFSPEESTRLAPWLLDYAVKRRDSEDSEDVASVLSAIRTGVSMLGVRSIDHLFTLLEPGHAIETSLVALKMLGRIFEAQPPTDVNLYPALATKVYEIAISLLNRYVITNSQSAAMAQLSTYALAAMASSEVMPIVEKVRQLEVTWFIQRTIRKLRDLKEIWWNRSVPVSDGPCPVLK